jgi:hypothetical protein
VPLTEVEVVVANANRRLMEDYSHWVVNW